MSRQLQVNFVDERERHPVASILAFVNRAPVPVGSAIVQRGGAC